MEVLEVIRHTEWAHGKGVKPNRLVLLKIKKGGSVEYTTHEELGTTTHKHAGYITGHYFFKIEDAVIDYKKRERKY